MTYHAILFTNDEIPAPKLTLDHDRLPQLERELEQNRIPLATIYNDGVIHSSWRHPDFSDDEPAY